MTVREAFSSLANVSLASHARLLSSAWCPDKDLVVLVVRVAGKDRLSLWKMQGNKIWEVDVDHEPPSDASSSSSSSATSAETSIVDVAWSPDSQ